MAIRARKAASAVARMGLPGSCRSFERSAVEDGGMNCRPCSQLALLFLLVARIVLSSGCSSSQSTSAMHRTAIGPLPAGGMPDASGTAKALLTDASTPRERAIDLVSRITLEEKIDYLGGVRSFFIRPVERLGIPEIKMADGPAGCRNWGPSTAYPSPIAYAASFDQDLAERIGRSIGRDCRARGVHILLAPGVNIHRSPLGGRNFEYLGEDPFLAGKTAAAFIRGVQSEGVLATVKHFAANNQEWDRNHISSEVDERTLREIYLPAFERAVREGKVSAVMTAYNLLNGTYCSQDPWLTRDVLREQWGFKGFVMSDWAAVHDTLGALRAGCDLEMPSGKFMNRDAILPLIEQKKIDPSVIDEKVGRILETVIAAGFLDHPQKREDIPLDDPSSVETALDTARKSVVLLKNTLGLLPIDRAKVRRIAVIGPNVDPPVVGGYGSAYVTPFHAVGLLEGLRRAAPDASFLVHAGVRSSSEFATLGQPCFVEPIKESVYAGTELAGAPISERTVTRINYKPEGGLPQPIAAGLPSENFSVRWTGAISVDKSGKYRVMTHTDDGARVILDGRKVIDDWTQHSAKMNAATVDLTPGNHSVVVEYYQGTGSAIAQFGFAPATGDYSRFDGSSEVSALARQADLVVVDIGFGQNSETNSLRSPFQGRWPPSWARQAGLVEAEDSDRPFALPPAQMETVKLALAANPRTIVIVNAGGAVDLQPVIARVPALLWAWYPGQEGGRALADVLLGVVSPSGRLPVTFAKRYDDYPSAPYYNVNQNGKTPYTEGVFVGYRGFESRNVEPLFPFGFGLSYTSFEFSELHAKPESDGSATVSLSVKNTGSRDGSEIVQIYVAPPKSSVARPPKELKAYASVTLEKGESKSVTLTLEPRAFAMWDVAKKQWSVEAGRYEVLAGSSSSDIRTRQVIEIGARTMAP